jgi:hypothetical protein
LIPHIRVEAGVHGKDVKLFYVDADGKETNISAACFEVQVNANVKGLTTVELKGYAAVKADVPAKQATIEFIERVIATRRG